MVMSNNKVYVWGDPETGVFNYIQCIGRKPTERRKFDQCLKVEALGYKRVVEIYTGSNHAFCKEIKGGRAYYYGWGMNNWGQLGLGKRADDGEVVLGQEVEFLRNSDVIDI